MNEDAKKPADPARRRQLIIALAIAPIAIAVGVYANYYVPKRLCIDFAAREWGKKNKEPAEKYKLQIGDFLKVTNPSDEELNVAWTKWTKDGIAKDHSEAETEQLWERIRKNANCR
jgi:hypothetical protein